MSLFSQEISDALMECYSRLVCSPRLSAVEEAQKLSHVKYTPPGSLRNREGKAIITTENRNLILASGTTGFRTWEAALHLGTFLSSVEGRSLVHGKNVVELGAGTGFISMYCAKYLDANSVVATDREPALMAHIQESMAKNDLRSDRIDACVWEWGTPLDLPSKPHPPGEKRPSSFDVALGADLV
jgi:predicted nicotinamide N-methyase